VEYTYPHYAQHTTHTVSIHRTHPKDREEINAILEACIETDCQFVEDLAAAAIVARGTGGEAEMLQRMV